jgi:hypothetical protein
VKKEPFRSGDAVEAVGGLPQLVVGHLPHPSVPKIGTRPFKAHRGCGALRQIKRRSRAADLSYIKSRSTRGG